jgi:hypothetical protein
VLGFITELYMFLVLALYFIFGKNIKVLQYLIGISIMPSIIWMIRNKYNRILYNLVSARIKLAFSIFITPLLIVLVMTDNSNSSLAEYIAIYTMLIAGFFFSYDGISQMVDTIGYAGFTFTEDKYDFRQIGLRKLLNRYLVALTISSIILNAVFYLSSLRLRSDGPIMPLLYLCLMIYIGIVSLFWLLLFFITTRNLYSMVISSKVWSTKPYPEWEKAIQIPKRMKIILKYVSIVIPVAIAIRFYLYIEFTPAKSIGSKFPYNIQNFYSILIILFTLIMVHVSSLVVHRKLFSTKNKDGL